LRQRPRGYCRCRRRQGLSGWVAHLSRLSLSARRRPPS